MLAIANVQTSNYKRVVGYYRKAADTQRLMLDLLKVSRYSYTNVVDATRNISGKGLSKKMTRKEQEYFSADLGEKDIFYNVGVIASERGFQALSIRILQHCIDRYPRFVDAYILAGDVVLVRCMGASRERENELKPIPRDVIDRATAYYKDALGMDPSSKQARDRLVTLEHLGTEPYK